MLRPGPNHFSTAKGYGKTLEELSIQLEEPMLREYIRRFLYDQLYPDSELCGMDVPLDTCPEVRRSLRVKVFHSAVSTYYAPSDLSGLGGMHRERIRATPSWKRGPARYDCVFIDKDPELPVTSQFRPMPSRSVAVTLQVLNH
jgi:hypothetical protein